ncbi:MAG: hypothetical protein KKA61_00955 [Nanoarchaeota archaeon]|nr:hypothetical protein [Nanoarchaeota archaeon]
MIKNKKATIFLTFVSIFILIAILFFYSNYGTKGEFVAKNPGNLELEILKTYQQAEKALLYIDLSAKYSANKTIKDIKEKQGSFENLKCNKEDCEITKKQVYDAFSADFNLYLNDYLKKYKETELKEGEELVIPSDNYDLLFKENRLIGIATENLKINKRNINYSIKPSFNIDIGFDLSEEYTFYFKQES